MVWFVFVIALFNLWVGYAVAVCFWLRPADAGGSATVTWQPDSRHFVLSPDPAGQHGGEHPDAGLARSIFESWRQVTEKLDREMTGLREQVAAADEPSIADLSVELRDRCQSLLAEIRQIEERSANTSDRSESVEQSSWELSAQLETSLSNLQHMGLEIGSRAGSRRLLMETEALMAASRRLTDQLDELDLPASA